jgi:hypothetical protein
MKKQLKLDFDINVVSSDQKRNSRLLTVEEIYDFASAEVLTVDYLSAAA